ncbi:hypothetical protein ACFLS4_02100 [Bacteroidota bacterium]
MKKLKKIIKWFFISLVGLLLIAIIILTITGFPKPGSITRADNIPHIGWKDVYRSFSVMKSRIDNSMLIDWQSDGESLYMVSKTGFMKRNLTKQTSSGSTPIIIDSIPDYASSISINPNTNINNAVVAIDELDNGIMKLYSFDFKTQLLIEISSDIVNYFNGFYNSKGDKYLYSHINKTSNFIDYYIVEPKNPKSSKLVYKGNIFFTRTDFFFTCFGFYYFS